MLSIVMVDPQIPPNTGNIARLCSCTATRLFLVGKLGFSLDDKYLKRAGLDYWKELDISYFEDFSTLKSKYSDGRFLYISTKATNIYTDFEFKKNDFLVFGSETKGLPEELIFTDLSMSLKIPMIGNSRSLNLSNAVSIVLYEAIRQTGILKK